MRDLKQNGWHTPSLTPWNINVLCPKVSVKSTLNNSIIHTEENNYYFLLFMFEYTLKFNLGEEWQDIYLHFKEYCDEMWFSVDSSNMVDLHYQK